MSDDSTVDAGTATQDPTVTPATDPPATDPVADTVDWKSETEKVRREAAKHRTEKNQLKGENEELKTRVSEFEQNQDNYEVAISEAAVASESLSRIKTALEAGLSGKDALDFYETLKGSTPEEWKEHAKSIAERLAPSTPNRVGDPSQGVKPGANPNLSPFGHLVQQVNNSQGR